jgi:hypothetical protein
MSEEEREGERMRLREGKSDKGVRRHRNKCKERSYRGECERDRERERDGGIKTEEESKSEIMTHRWTKRKRSILRRIRKGRE